MAQQARLTVVGMGKRHRHVARPARRRVVGHVHGIRWAGRSLVVARCPAVADAAAFLAGPPDGQVAGDAVAIERRSPRPAMGPWLVVLVALEAGVGRVASLAAPPVHGRHRGMSVEAPEVVVVLRPLGPVALVAGAPRVAEGAVLRHRVARALRRDLPDDALGQRGARGHALEGFAHVPRGG